MIELPDVSYGQGEINWTTMATKTKNIIIRAGQGNWRDTYFKYNWPGAKSNGIKRSTYWFYDGRYSPNEQFNALSSALAPDPPEARIWIDWEKSYAGNYEGLHNVVALMKMAEKSFPHNRVGMYTGYYWFIENSSTWVNKTEYEYLANKLLWLAQWDTNPADLLIPLPWEYDDVELQQWGTPEYGQEYGCQSIELDMSRVLHNPEGTYLEGDTEMPADEIEQAWYEVYNCQYLNIRNQPGATTSASDIGDLPVKAIVLADKSELMSGVTWFHFIDARLNGDPEGTAIATSNGQLVSQRQDCWSSGQYLRKTTLPVHPVDPADDAPVEATIVTASGKKYKATSFTEVT